MTLGLLQIAILSVGALSIGAMPPRARRWALLIASLIAVYLLQPRLTPRYADFVLPTLTIALAIASWGFTRAPSTDGGSIDTRQSQTWRREDWVTLACAVGVAIALSLTRFLPNEARPLPSRPPDPLLTLIAVCGGAGLASALAGMARRTLGTRALMVWLITVIALFVAITLDPFTTTISTLWRGAAGQDTTLATPIDLGWLGFSYLAFRLIHTIRDRQSGLLPALSLREYLTYIVFAPALVAGPIDRAERFTEDLRARPPGGVDADRVADGARRIAVGLFKKFVVADLLAQGLTLAAGETPFGSAAPPLAWLLLYGYGVRLWLDFSGYTDIAIGIARLVGIRLPENFDRPYLKSNLAQFWQSWHMTLSAWARAYLFSPISRALLMRQPRPSPTLIVLSAHLVTMLTIGLWHGITINFAIWGLWHGVGLFAQKQWSDRTRRWHRSLTPRAKRWYTVGMWALTVHYVMLGWLWFALPTPGSAVRGFASLFGMRVAP